MRAETCVASPAPQLVAAQQAIQHLAVDVNLRPKPLYFLSAITADVTAISSLLPPFYSAVVHLRVTNPLPQAVRVLVSSLVACVGGSRSIAGSLGRWALSGGQCAGAVGYTPTSHAVSFARIIPAYQLVSCTVVFADSIALSALHESHTHHNPGILPICVLVLRLFVSPTSQ